MTDGRKLNYLKHCYKKIVENDRLKQWAVDTELESTYNYLIGRIQNAGTSKEEEYFTVLLKRFIDPKHMEDDEQLVLYETEKDELFMWVEFRPGAQTILLDTNYPDDAFSSFNAEEVFRHSITIDGESLTVEDYLQNIAFDYSYIER